MAKDGSQENAVCSQVESNLDWHQFVRLASQPATSYLAFHGKFAKEHLRGLEEVVANLIRQSAKNNPTGRDKV